MVVSRLTFFRGMLVRGFPPPYRGTGHAFDRGNDELGGRNDECGGGVIQAHSKPRNVIFVPMTGREIGGIPRHYRSQATLFSYQ